MTDKKFKFDTVTKPQCILSTIKITTTNNSPFSKFCCKAGWSTFPAFHEETITPLSHGVQADWDAAHVLLTHGQQILPLAVVLPFVPASISEVIPML